MKAEVSIRRLKVHITINTDLAGSSIYWKVRITQHLGVGKRDVVTSSKSNGARLATANSYEDGLLLGKEIRRVVIDRYEYLLNSSGLQLPPLPPSTKWLLQADFADQDTMNGFRDFLMPGDETYVKLGIV